MFRANQPPKHHRVRVWSATGQRTLNVRYVRMSGVRVTDVDRVADTVRCLPDAQVRVQIGEQVFAPQVLAGAEITLSTDGLSGRSRARFLRSAERAAGGPPVEVVLDGPKGRLG